MFTNLLVVSLLCAAFPPTRLIGIAGLAILSYFYPPLLIGLLIFGAIILYFIYRK